MEDEIRGMPVHYWMSKFARAEVGKIVGMAFRYQAMEAEDKAAKALYHRQWAAKRYQRQLRKPVRSVGVEELPISFAQDRRVRRMMRLAEVCG